MGRYCPILKAAGIGESTAGIGTMNPEALDNESKLIASVCLACKRERCYYDEGHKQSCPQKQEQIMKVGEMLRSGVSRLQIVAQLGISERTVQRYWTEYLRMNTYNQNLAAPNAIKVP